MASASASWGPTFMDQFRTAAGKPYEFNRKSWEAAVKAGYGGHQIKTAIQREFRDRPTGRPNTGPLLRSDYMKHYKGSGQQHDGRPGSEFGFMDFMGDAGNIGIKAYTAAKEAGYKPDEIQSLASKYGMYLPEAATAQYQKDTQSEFDARMEEQRASFDNSMGNFQTDVADIMKAFTSEPGTPPDSTVLRGQSGQIQARKGRLAGAGTNQFKRGYSLAKIPNNLGIRSSAAGSGPLNIV